MATMDFQRNRVAANLESEIADNLFNYQKGNPFASSEYIYPNQESDAENIVNLFRAGKRVISVQKRTKIGADGLMISVCCKMASCEDGLIVPIEDIHILTGMSNKLWENSMIDKSPSFLKSQIHHHGKLSKVKINQTGGSLIIIDEIDVGDKKKQKLHKLLDSYNLLDLQFLIDNNIYLVFISATILKEMVCVDKWGDIHQNIILQVPDDYVSIKYMYDEGHVHEYYKLIGIKEAIQWIEEDIIEHFGDEYRVHLISCDVKSSQNIVNAALFFHNVEAIYHNNDERIDQDTLNKHFMEKRDKHIIIMVKKLYSRANLIPNAWKINIGSIMDRWTNKPDYNVLNQGIVRRMTGFWKPLLVAGHKPGKYRTSIASVLEYEKVYENPYSDHNYIANGFSMKTGVPVVKGLALGVDCLRNMTTEEPVEVRCPKTVPLYVELNPFQMASIGKKGLSWDFDTIRPLLSEEIVTELSTLYQAYITKPETDKNKALTSDRARLAFQYQTKQVVYIYGTKSTEEREELARINWYGIIISDTATECGLYIIRMLNESI